MVKETFESIITCLLSGRLIIMSGLKIEPSSEFNSYYKNILFLQLVLNFEAIFQVIRFYGLYFFLENYALEEEQVYDFVLGCSENKALIDLFKKNRHEEVIEAFDQFYTTQYNEN